MFCHIAKTRENMLTEYVHMFPLTYFTCCNSNQRGVAIMTNRNVHFSLDNTIIAPEGRYLIVYQFKVLTYALPASWVQMLKTSPFMPFSQHFMLTGNTSLIIEEDFIQRSSHNQHG